MSIERLSWHPSGGRKHVTMDMSKPPFAPLVIASWSHSRMAVECTVLGRCSRDRTLPLCLHMFTMARRIIRFRHMPRRRVINTCQRRASVLWAYTFSPHTTRWLVAMRCNASKWIMRSLLLTIKRDGVPHYGNHNGREDRHTHIMHSFRNARIHITVRCKQSTEEWGRLAGMLRYRTALHHRIMWNCDLFSFTYFMKFILLVQKIHS